jgi:hypothetical protein
VVIRVGSATRTSLTGRGAVRIRRDPAPATSAVGPEHASRQEFTRPSLFCPGARAPPIDGKPKPTASSGCMALVSPCCLQRTPIGRAICSRQRPLGTRRHDSAHLLASPACGDQRDSAGRRLLLIVRSAPRRPASGWFTGEKGGVQCPRLSRFLLPLYVHLPGASQPTSRAGRRRLRAEPRRDWARR